MDEYYTYTKELVGEGRRVFALNCAIQASGEKDSALIILQAAAAFEAWLQEAERPAEKPAKPKLVK